MNPDKEDLTRMGRALDYEEDGEQVQEKLVGCESDDCLHRTRPRCLPNKID